MKILLDESVPVQIRNALGGHVVTSVNTLGWKGLENGRLLAEAESHGYDVLITQTKTCGISRTSRRDESHWSSSGRITGRRSNGISR